METWKKIPDWPDYSVSDHGRVRRDVAHCWRTHSGRILKPWPTRHGYLAVYLCGGGQKKSMKVHRLVLLAFVGKPPTDKNEAAHWDGDVSNNRLTNLRWATKSENMYDMSRHGRNKGGCRGSRLFDAITSTEIRWRSTGESINSLAKSYGVSWDAIKTAIRSGARANA